MELTFFDNKFLYFIPNKSKSNNDKEIKLENYQLKKVKATWSVTKKAFYIPLNYFNLNQVLSWKWDINPLIFDLISQISQDFQKRFSVMKYLKKFKAYSDDIKQVINDLKLPKELDILRDYQKLDAYICANRKTFANFNAMRSGKTLTTAASLNLRTLNSQKPVKVIISILQSNWLQWVNELKQICNQFQIFNISRHENSKKRSEIWNDFFNTNNHAIILINKEKINLDILVKTDKKVAFKPSYLKNIKKQEIGFIVDEAHFLRNEKTNQAIASILLAKHASFRIVLTATKISNKALDLYGVFKFLHPEIYTSKWYFLERYFIEEKSYIYETKGINKGKLKEIRKFNEFDPSTKAELMSLIFMDSIERTEEEVLDFLPEYIEYEPEIIPMSTIHEKSYNEFLENMEFNNGEDYISYPNAISMRIKLLQASTNPKSVLGINIESPTNKAIINWLNNNPERIPIIFGVFTNSTLNPLIKELQDLNYKVGIITGETKDKAKVANDFQNGKYDLIIANIKAGGTGLTLSHADTTIFIELDDTMANNEQAKKRMLATDRNDKREKEIHYFLIENSIQVFQLQEINIKKGISDELIPKKIYDKLKIINDIIKNVRRI